MLANSGAQTAPPRLQSSWPLTAMQPLSGLLSWYKEDPRIILAFWSPLPHSMKGPRQLGPRPGSFKWHYWHTGTKGSLSRTAKVLLGQRVHRLLPGKPKIPLEITQEQVLHFPRLSVLLPPTWTWAQREDYNYFSNTLGGICIYFLRDFDTCTLQSVQSIKHRAIK